MLVNYINKTKNNTIKLNYHKNISPAVQKSNFEFMKKYGKDIHGL